MWQRSPPPPLNLKIINQLQSYYFFVQLNPFYKVFAWVRLFRILEVTSSCEVSRGINVSDCCLFTEVRNIVQQPQLNSGIALPCGIAPPYTNLILCFTDFFPCRSDQAGRRKKKEKIQLNFTFVSLGPSFLL